MERFFLSCIFLIPVIGLYSGLSLAITVPVFTFSCLISLKKLLTFNLKDYKLELVFVFWLLASSLWSINSMSSLANGLKFSTEFFTGLLLIANINKLNLVYQGLRSKTEKVLLTSFFVSVIAFFTEYFTGGGVSLFFRQLTQKEESHTFFLHNLDRGMSIFALLCWVIIGSFVQKSKKWSAAILYVISMIVLTCSDNLAASFAHIIGGLVFIITRFTILKNPRILCILLILASSLMIIFAFTFDAKQITRDEKFLPLSGSHRLFIWDFVAQNSLSQPFTGIGFNSSRNFPVQEEQIIDLDGHKLRPLPLHPHNNILQVYFELGIIGLVLYLGLICTYLLVIGKNYMTEAPAQKSVLSVIYAGFSVYFIIAMLSYNSWQSWWVQLAIFVSALFTCLFIKPFAQVSK